MIIVRSSNYQRLLFQFSPSITYGLPRNFNCWISRATHLVIAPILNLESDVQL